MQYIDIIQEKIIIYKEVKMRNNLKKLLTDKNMTQKELSEITGITESAISRYTKENRIPRGDNLIKIARALNVQMEDILDV